jgi:biotin operon repressor
MSNNDKSAMPDFFTVPYRIMYLPGMVHNYALVYQQIFRFWYNKSNCFISNAELSKRVGCSSTTVKEAIRFFEKNGEIKRVMTSGRRYLVQPELSVGYTEEAIGSDINPVDDRGGEIPPGGGRDSVPGGGEIPPHNINTNIKKLTSSANEFAQAWELFWKAYPVKKNKSRAMTTFKSKKLYKQIDVILKHIEQSTKTDKKWLDGYIPHPSTYLNGKRWEDEIETVTGFDQSPSKPYVSNNIIEPLESRKPISKDFSNSYMKNFKSA